MDFDFNINAVFPDTISLINWETVQKEQRKPNNSYKQLQFVIDCLGKRSAKAQQLTGSITSLQKSQINAHNIYVLKENDSNSGLGSIIGFIKVGRKHLFVLDHDGNHIEMHPLCVLDFYVHESQQRKGCGLSLFKHMLYKENVQAQHLAIDRPSHKFICFLKKHFSLWATIPQVNNFVVFDGFFKNRSDNTQTRNSRRNWNSSYYRPLSRAVSDDVIKRTRKDESSTFSTNLNGIRPASSTEMANSDFNSSRIRRKKWNLDGTLFFSNAAKPPPTAQPNLFSRHMQSQQDRTAARPPIHPSHQKPRYRMHEGINDPYEKNPGNFEKKAVSSNLNGINPLPNNDELDSHSADPLNHYGEAENNHPLKAQKLETNACNDTTHIVDNERPSNSQLSDTRPPRLYSKPSDMILELQNKDEQFLLGTKNKLPSVYSRNWNRRQLKGIGSSWNVLGVPSTPFWSNQ